MESMSVSLQQIVEALVFASPKAMSLKEITAAVRAAGEQAEEGQVAKEFVRVGETEIATALAEVQAGVIASGRPFQLVERVQGWTMVTNPEFAPWVRQLYPEARPTRLTGPQIETLAIIAYRQPVTRADLEAVRGVSVDGVMQVLLDRSLVKIAGRADLPGRPLLYETTEYFLQHFGLRSTEELPNNDELRRVPLPKAEVKEETKSKPAAAEVAPEPDVVPAEAAPEEVAVSGDAEGAVEVAEAGAECGVEDAAVEGVESGADEGSVDETPQS